LKATPTRPNISEVFEAGTHVEVYQNGTTTYGEGTSPLCLDTFHSCLPFIFLHLLVLKLGFMGSDQPAGKFVEQFDIETDEHQPPYQCVCGLSLVASSRAL
jgi:hypothetical protein